MAAIAGCGRDDIQVYRVAKETPSAEAQAPMAVHGQDQEQSTVPRVQFRLPSGWQEVPPGSMRAASFSIGGKDGQAADVGVIPLPGVTGRDLDFVNLWRKQVQLPTATEAEMTKENEAVAIGADQGKLFDMVSEKPIGESKTPTRIVIAMLTKDGTSWFFKMTGDDSIVRDQKPAFVQFLKSITFQPAVQPIQFARAPRALSTNSKQTPRENSEKPIWIVPAGWQEVPAGQMLVAKFLISGDNGAKAELNVGAAGGGLLFNINRWRGQLGLAPLQETDLEKQLQPLDVAGGKAMLVDMAGTDGKTGQKARLLGAVVPQAGQTWFYKLMGNEQVVEREKEAFTRFVQTIKYPNAP
jgi:hypothetical protein